MRMRKAFGIQRRSMIASRFLALLVPLMLAGTIMAQTTTGSIYGTVIDKSGAVIPNVTVTATNEATDETDTVSSNGSGNYIFPALVPGNYTVSAYVAGFKTETQKQVRLDVSQNVHMSFSLQPGSTKQTVTVTAATTLVDTRESQLGETVGEKQIQDLPLNGRNAYDLVTLVPGVTHYSAEPAIGNNNGNEFSDNGIRTGNNSTYLDGAYDTNLYRNGGNLVPNPDALQEFRLLTGNFDAEYGRLPGGVVNMITRSGTNAYHGLLYDYLRNNVLNAKSYFLTSVTPLRQNQFGGNFGGPIIHQKVFFFLDYEGLRIRTPAFISSASIVTPTPAEATGNFSALPSKSWPKQANGQPYSCNGVQGEICPNLLDPVAQKVLKFVPLSNPATGHPPQQSSNADVNADQGLVHVDDQLTSKHRLSGMFFISRGSSNDPNTSDILDYDGELIKNSQTNLVASDSWTISPNALNSLHLFYTESHIVISNLFTTNYLSDLGIQTGQGGFLPTQVGFSITGYWHMGNAHPKDIAQQSFGVFDTFNWTRGNHTIKAGGFFMWNKYSETSAGEGSGAYSFTGDTTGNALADFLLGHAYSFEQDNGYYHRTHLAAPALFVQDDWRATHRLTLDLGLRWEVFPPLAGQNNYGTFKPYVRSTRFPTAPLGLLSSGDPGVPDGVLYTSYKDFAPRVGFAYDLFGNGATALRGAYGIFYANDSETIVGNLEQQPFEIAMTIHETPNITTPYAPEASPFPYPVNPTNPIFVPNATVDGVGKQTGIPYVQEYNLTVQQQLGTNWGMQIAYVGNTLRAFYLLRDQNSPVYSPGASITTAGLNARRPYQPTPKTYTFGEIGDLDPIANASYNSLQATLKRRFVHRFSLSASYVWSKDIDIASGDPGSFGDFQLSDNNNPARDRGLSTLDVPQHFVASYLWATPDVRLWGAVGRQVLSGWQLNGITTLSTGSPFNVLSNKDTNRDGIKLDRPNLVGNPILSSNRSRAQKIKEFFNTAAFAQITANNVPYGTSPRDPLIGPGTVNTDFSAFKTFPIWKESSLQFRGEIFNLFNNVNLDNPNGTLTSPNYGKITGSGSPRIVQFALRYMF